MLKTNSIQSQSLQSLRLTIMTGLFAAVSAALGFALIAIPNVEMITASIFLSGMLLGRMRGAIVGVTAEFIYSALNPMGTAFPPLMAAQIITMGIVGFAGGLTAALVKERVYFIRAVIIGFIGFLVTLNFDFWTTISFPISAGLNMEQIITTLKLGVPFAIPHLAGNTVIFALIITPAYSNLRKFVPIAVWMLILTTAAILPACVNASENIYETDSETFESIYYEDMGDILSTIPGVFQYDLGLFGQPLYIYNEMGTPRVFLYGIPLNSHYTGLFDYNQMAPNYLKRIALDNGSDEGFISSEGAVNCTPRTFDPEIPYSRINYRDGYYGLGVVDFIFAQKLGAYRGFQIGGRISEFNGRRSNSAHKMEQFRSALYWRRPQSWDLTAVFITNRNKTQITNSTDRRLAARSDIFLTAQDSLSQSSAVVHYYFTEDDYYGKPDPLEEGYDLKLQRNFRHRSFQFRPSLYLNWYRVNSGNGSAENQASAVGNMTTLYSISENLSAEGALSLEAGRDNLPGAALTITAQIDEFSKASLSLERSGKSPAFICRTYDLTAENVYLPGSYIWELPPDAEIEPNYNLDPEITNAVRAFGDFKIGEFISIKPSLFFKQLENHIRLYHTNGNTYFWLNDESYNISGAGTDLFLGRRSGFGLKISYTLQLMDERRNFIPASYGQCWIDYRNRAFEDNLDYAIEIHGRYIGERQGEIDEIHKTLGDDNIWGVRFTFKIGDFTLFWGNENIFAWQYEIIPGYKMIHREEVWGVNWIFWD